MLVSGTMLDTSFWTFGPYGTKYSCLTLVATRTSVKNTNWRIKSNFKWIYATKILLCVIDYVMNKDMEIVLCLIHLLYVFIRLIKIKGVITNQYCIHSWKYSIVRYGKLFISSLTYQLLLKNRGFNINQENFIAICVYNLLKVSIGMNCFH